MKKVSYSLVLTAILAGCCPHDAQVVATGVHLVSAVDRFKQDCWELAQDVALQKNHFELLTSEQEDARKASWNANKCDEKRAALSATTSNAIQAVESASAASEAAR